MRKNSVAGTAFQGKVKTGALAKALAADPPDAGLVTAAAVELAEQYAADAVYVANAALSDAEEAIIDAVIARNDAAQAKTPVGAAS